MIDFDTFILDFETKIIKEGELGVFLQLAYTLQHFNQVKNSIIL